MFGKLNTEEIEEVLSHQIIGRIGCYADGIPYIVPISYAYDGEYIFCHTYEGLKVSMMRTNPEVCFEVDIMENMANWKSVISWGKFEELKNGTTRKVAIQKLYNRVIPAIASKTLQLTPQWPFPPDDYKKIEGIVFRIRLDKKTGRFEKSDSTEFARLNDLQRFQYLFHFHTS
jgi:nitroimidazol reductase NimA-like FMN-containing flavoprotein (pyridoxamine 5'-phosphate oxidase superfamily)